MPVKLPIVELTMAETGQKEHFIVDWQLKELRNQFTAEVFHRFEDVFELHDFVTEYASWLPADWPDFPPLEITRENARTIGAKIIKLLKALVPIRVEQYRKAHGYTKTFEIVESIRADLPEALWNTWEMADQEINRVLYDAINEYENRPDEYKAQIALPKKVTRAAGRVRKPQDISSDVYIYMPKQQQKTVLEGLRGEEAQYFRDVAARLNDIVAKMPVLYGDEKTPAAEDKIIYLHYFYGGSDWYIAEKGTAKEPNILFGYAILGGDTQNAEWGYVDVNELSNVGLVELDFHWTPQKFNEIIKLQEYGLVEKPKEHSAMSEAIQGAYDRVMGMKKAPPVAAPAQNRYPSNEERDCYSLGRRDREVGAAARPPTEGKDLVACKSAYMAGYDGLTFSDYSRGLVGYKNPTEMSVQCVWNDTTPQEHYRFFKDNQEVPAFRLPDGKLWELAGMDYSAIPFGVRQPINNVLHYHIRQMMATGRENPKWTAIFYDRDKVTGELVTELSHIETQTKKDALQTAKQMAVQNDWRFVELRDGFLDKMGQQITQNPANPSDMLKAKELYRTWHGFDESGIKDVDIPVEAKHFTPIGKMMQLDYESDKDVERDGSREIIHYYHYIKKHHPTLAKDDKGRLHILGNMKVLKEGIDDWDSKQPNPARPPEPPKAAVTKLGRLKLIVYDDGSKDYKALNGTGEYLVAHPNAKWLYIAKPTRGNPTVPYNMPFRDDELRTPAYMAVSKFAYKHQVDASEMTDLEGYLSRKWAGKIPMTFKYTNQELMDELKRIREERKRQGSETDYINALIDQAWGLGYTRADTDPTLGELEIWIPKLRALIEAKGVKPKERKDNPFKSEAQRRYLWAKEPAIARRWAHTYGSRPSENPDLYDAMYDSKEITVEADSLYQAKLKAIELLKPPKSKQHLVIVAKQGSTYYPSANPLTTEDYMKSLGEEQIAAAVYSERAKHADKDEKAMLHHIIREEQEHHRDLLASSAIHKKNPIILEERFYKALADTVGDKVLQLGWGSDNVLASMDSPSKKDAKILRFIPGDVFTTEGPIGLYGKPITQVTEGKMHERIQARRYGETFIPYEIKMSYRDKDNEGPEWTLYIDVLPQSRRAIYKAAGGDFKIERTYLGPKALPILPPMREELEGKVTSYSNYERGLITEGLIDLFNLHYANWRTDMKAQIPEDIQKKAGRQFIERVVSSLTLKGLPLPSKTKMRETFRAIKKSPEYQKLIESPKIYGITQNPNDSLMARTIQYMIMKEALAQMKRNPEAREWLKKFSRALQEKLHPRHLHHIVKGHAGELTLIKERLGWKGFASALALLLFEQVGTPLHAWIMYEPEHILELQFAEKMIIPAITWAALTLFGIVPPGEDE